MSQSRQMKSWFRGFWVVSVNHEDQHDWMGPENPWSQEMICDGLAGFSINSFGGFHSHGGTPKWMVYNGKSHENG